MPRCEIDARPASGFSAANQTYYPRTANRNQRRQNAQHVRPDVSPLCVVPINQALPHLHTDAKKQNADRAQTLLHAVHTKQKRKQGRKPVYDDVKSGMKRLPAGNRPQPQRLE